MDDTQASTLWTTVSAVMDKPGAELYHLTLTIRAHREGGQWAAFCQELGVHSCGDSAEEAIENVIEATLLYLNGIEELGERRRTFDDLGIEPQIGLPKPDDQATLTPVSTDEYVTRMVAAAGVELARA